MKTILVVEDEITIAEMIHAVLSDEGYQIVLANNGRQALALLAERRYDLVLCDVMMPVMDGRALCRAMRADAALSTIPLVLMSAVYGSRIEGCEPRAFLSKPFLLEELIDLVSSLIGSGDTLS